MIFPLPPDFQGRYDNEFNVLHSFHAVWSTNRHAIYNLLSMNAVAVAPRWLLTAGHVARGLNEQSYVNDDHDRYYVQEKVFFEPDIALVKVARVLPFYSRLARDPASEGELLTAYGQSAAPLEPILDGSGVPRGWKFGPLTNHVELRWGLGRKAPGTHQTVEWEFTNADPEMGLRCAGVNTNDSGGGIFLGDAVLGVLTSLRATGYKLDPAQASTNNCGRPLGLTYDTSPFLSCSADRPPPLTRAIGTAVYPLLSNIYSVISPPELQNIGGETLSDGVTAWQGTPACEGCGRYLDANADPIDTTGVTNPAPQAVYHSAAYLNGEPEKSLTFTIGERIVYERFNVRLHFASIFPANAPQASLQRVSVNGRERLIDPYTGPRQAAAVTFPNIVPDPQGRIVINIRPQNPRGRATLSGIEVSMVPYAPAPRPELPWEIVARYPDSPSPASEASPAAAARPRAASDGTHLVIVSPYPGVPVPLLYSSGAEGSLRQPNLPRGIGLLRGITQDRNGFVAVGDGGAILRSPDGKDWTPATAGAAEDLRAIAFDGQRWVAVGANGVILTSGDGKAFVRQFPVTSAALNAVAAGSGLFVAAGERGKVLISSDGRSWSGKQLAANEWFGAAFGNGRFVLAGQDGRAAVSIGGLDWTRVQAWDQTLTDVAFAGGFFVAVDPFTSRAVISKDGFNWELMAHAPPGVLSVSESNGDLYYSGRGETAYIARSRLSPAALALHPFLDPSERPGIAFRTPRFATYRILATPDIVLNPWQTVAILTNTLAVQDLGWTNSTATPNRLFFRVQEE